jgi:signal peptide peptidase SppA
VPPLPNNPDAGLEASCRPDQLFGLWAIEETRFRRSLELVQGADLDTLRAESRAAAADAAGRPLYRTTADGIARIDVSGPLTKYPTSFQALLGGTSMLRTREALRTAARDPEVVGILVVIDSPGGTVHGTADLAEAIRQADTRKPVYTYAEDFAASAALWLLSQGRKAFANAGAEVGSIGAYLVVEDTSGLYAKHDVKVHVVRSAAFKGAGVDGAPITEDQLAEWQRRLNDMADVFVSQVATGRRMDKSAVEALHTGQVWVADKARAHGLIDDVVSLEEATRRLRSEAMNEQDLATAKAAQEKAEAEAKTQLAARQKAEAENAELQKRLDDLQAKGRKTRFAAEAKELGAPEAFAEVLDAIEGKVGETVYGQLTTQLKAFKEQSRTAAVFEEKGSNTKPSSTKAFDQAKALAEAKVKSGQSKSFAVALATVWAENPELWKQYEEERG